MPKLTTAMFEKDGRMFTLPGFQYLTDSKEPDDGDPIAITYKAMSISAVLGTQLTWEQFETRDDDPWAIDKPCAIGSITSNIFMHGGCKAWIFSGPEFDEAVKGKVE